MVIDSKTNIFLQPVESDKYILIYRDKMLGKYNIDSLGKQNKAQKEYFLGDLEVNKETYIVEIKNYFIVIQGGGEMILYYKVYCSFIEMLKDKS